MITLRLKREPTVPLEAEVLVPDRLAALETNEVAAQTIYHGKRQFRLDEFFEIEFEGAADERLQIHGNLERVRWIGRRMSRGALVVHGSVGMHLGAWMRGGTIEVHGNAGDWVGAEMSRGLIRVHGDAGGQVGAAYRGSLRGMRNGAILVDGKVGLEVGMRMRRGTVVIGRTARDFTGLQMKGGTIVLLEGAELRTGAWMNRGTIISLRPLEMMPTFRYACRGKPVIFAALARFLDGLGVQLPAAAFANPFDLYSGDTAVPGKGEIFVPCQPT